MKKVQIKLDAPKYIQSSAKIKAVILEKLEVVFQGSEQTFKLNP